MPLAEWIDKLLSHFQFCCLLGKRGVCIKMILNTHAQTIKFKKISSNFFYQSQIKRYDGQLFVFFPYKLNLQEPQRIKMKKI